MASSVILKRIDDFELSLDNLAVLKIFATENLAASSHSCTINASAGHRARMPERAQT